MSKTKPNTAVGAFVINNEAIYPWFVYPVVPNGKGGRIKLKYKAIFRHVSKERRIELLEDLRKNVRNSKLEITTEEEIDAQLKYLSLQDLILEECLVGWEGIVDKDGNEFAYNDESRAIFLNNEWARNSVMDGFAKSLQTRDDTGNS